MLLEKNRAIGWGLYDWVSLEYLTLSRVHADPPEIHHLWFREPGAQVPLAVSAHDSLLQEAMMTCVHLSLQS